ncbi:hypothetical protein [Nibribacter koreensis]|uniref:Uncharacterized protein n=1 Tax=Nibribacter koreensis TaxID=1084519 RepID=A0ABP8FSP4_9BACT
MDIKMKPMTQNLPAHIRHELPQTLTTRRLTPSAGDLTELEAIGLGIGMPGGGLLTLAEGLCVGVLAELARYGFPSCVIYAIGKMLTANIEVEGIELPSSEGKLLFAEMTLLDLYLEEAMEKGSDTLLQVTRDGRIQLISSCSAHPHPAGGCVSLPLLAMANQLFGKQVCSFQEKRQTLLDEAELALLAAVSEPAYKEVQVIKSRKAGTHRWDLLTLESGVASPQELHRMAGHTAGTADTVSLTGLPGQRKAAYTYTRRKRY